MQQIWIWTSKIIPELWLSAVFCPIKKIKINPSYYPGPCLPHLCSQLAIQMVDHTNIKIVQLGGFRGSYVATAM